MDSIVQRCMIKQCRPTCEILQVHAHVLPVNSYCNSGPGAVLWLVAMPLIPSVAPLQFFLFRFFKKSSCQTDRMECGLNTGGPPPPAPVGLPRKYVERIIGRTRYDKKKRRRALNPDITTTTTTRTRSQKMALAYYRRSCLT